MEGVLRLSGYVPERARSGLMEALSYVFNPAGLGRYDGCPSEGQGLFSIAEYGDSHPFLFIKRV